MKTIIGPFDQVLCLGGLALKGALSDEQIQVHAHAAILVNDGKVVKIGSMNELVHEHPDAAVEAIDQPAVLLPGFVDCHTHICYGGNRSADYAMRIAGHSYLDIARQGGGIWSSVQMTRKGTEQELTESLLSRINRHLQEGITTIEIKSGYGLSVDEELKMLRAINHASAQTPATIVSTCLAAHVKPKDFEGSAQAYLEKMAAELLPVLRQQELASRVDVFVEETAFNIDDAKTYLLKAKEMGFEITVHADQFSAGGSRLAVEVGAQSADHLEASGEREISMLAESNTVAVALPGASLGLGMQYPPCRKLLDAGACLAIASDWNPGSAPMGDLLMQASVMAASEKLSTAEVFAALTSRAAHALGLHDRGELTTGKLAHLQAYPTSDYRDILYYQGRMKPFRVWCG